MCAFDKRSLVRFLLIKWGMGRKGGCVCLFEIVLQSKQGRSDSGGCSEIDAREIIEDQKKREDGPVLPDRDSSQKLAEGWRAG